MNCRKMRWDIVVTEAVYLNDITIAKISRQQNIRIDMGEWDSLMYIRVQRRESNDFFQI